MDFDIDFCICCGGGDFYCKDHTILARAILYEYREDENLPSLRQQQPVIVTVTVSSFSRIISWSKSLIVTHQQIKQNRSSSESFIKKRNHEMTKQESNCTQQQLFQSVS